MSLVCCCCCRRFHRRLIKDTRNPNLISQNLPGKTKMIFQASSEKSSLATEVRQPTSPLRAILTQSASFDDNIDVTKRLPPNVALQASLCKRT